MLDYNQIKEIIKEIDSSSLRVFELECQDIKLKLSKNKENSIYNNIICTNVCAVGCGAWCWSVVQVVEIISDNDS